MVGEEAINDGQAIHALLKQVSGHTSAFLQVMEVMSVERTPRIFDIISCSAKERELVLKLVSQPDFTSDSRVKLTFRIGDTVFTGILTVIGTNATERTVIVSMPDALVRQKARLQTFTGFPGAPIGVALVGEIWAWRWAILAGVILVVIACCGGLAMLVKYLSM